MAEARAIRLPEFADSFDHRLEPAFPTLVGWIEGSVRGYMQMERRWLVTPAIHPGINRPRDTLALARTTLSALSQLCPGYLLQREDNRNDVFTCEIMAKLGLKEWPYHVYQAR